MGNSAESPGLRRVDRCDLSLSEEAGTPDVGRNAAWTIAISMMLMAGIITVAALAPVKRIETVLDEKILLKQSQLTVAELADFLRWNRKHLPLKIAVPAGGAAKDTRVTFSSLELPLGKFISEFERQTQCRHRFSGCGNAYSILYGSAYNLGLSFEPPSESEITWE